MATVGEIMTREVCTLTRDTSVTEAARLMVKGRFGSVLVLDAGWIAGIFTERDVLRAAASGEDLATSAVSRWMTADPTTVEEGLETEAALEMMAAQGFRHLPVTDGGTLLGIVSLRDLLSTRIARSPR